jgi:hypothetical protein
MKTVVCEDIYPKTTHTLLIVYYTSYLTTFSTTFRPIISYYCENDYAAIIIQVSSYTGDPKLSIRIYASNNNLHKEYIVKANEPKVIIDLTAELAVAIPGKEIKSANFSGDLYDNLEIFYQHCINILNNVFISYTYED